MSDKYLRIYVATTIFAVIIGYYVFSTLRKNGGISRVRSTAAVGKGFAVGGQNVDHSRFTGAETFRSVSSQELLVEVENVLEQKGLPADIFYGLSVKISNEEKQKQQEFNIAVTLYNEFHVFDTTESNDLEKLWDASPIGEWNVDAQTLADVQTQLSGLAGKRQIIRNRLLDHRTHFYYVFHAPNSAQSSSRTLVDTWASKYLADYALLEEYAIAQALLDGNINEAINSLNFIFRIAQLASMLGNVGVRTDAALVRLRAFDVMQRVILDPKFEKKYMIELREILSDQHDHWTPETVTWLGDRASGMMLYNRISTSGPDDAMEPSHLEALKERHVYDPEDEGRMGSVFVRGFQKYHEADAVFYLQSMQKLLNVSDKPFKQRLIVLKNINNELADRENTKDEAGIAMEYFVAGLMLKEVKKMMEIFAKDQSALERALAAILRSLGQSNTDRFRDPFTDAPYVVRTEQGLFSVSTEMLPRPFRVPIFTDKE